MRSCKKTKAAPAPAETPGCLSTGACALLAELVVDEAAADTGKRDDDARKRNDGA